MRGLADPSKPVNYLSGSRVLRSPSAGSHPALCILISSNLSAGGRVSKSSLIRLFYPCWAGRPQAGLSLQRMREARALWGPSLPIIAEDGQRKMYAQGGPPGGGGARWHFFSLCQPGRQDPTPCSPQSGNPPLAEEAGNRPLLGSRGPPLSPCGFGGRWRMFGELAKGTAFLLPSSCRSQSCWKKPPGAGLAGLFWDD